LVSAVIRTAIDRKLRVKAVTFAGATFIDIGTPAGLVKAFQSMTMPYAHASTELDY
jgi:hypothetical protein